MIARSYCDETLPNSRRQTVGICDHVRRPVSQDRRILVMEVEVGKAVYLSYNIFTTNTTDIFVLQIGYRSLGF